jgi:hypothetical protein
MSSKAALPCFVGPHDDNELALMVAGQKPMCMFVEPIDSEFEIFEEDEFDKLVAEGKLIKRINIEIDKPFKGRSIRRVIYATPDEEWRINALLMVQGLYDTLLPGWHPDLDRVIGLLLGYARSDVDSYVAWISSRHSNK